MLKKFDKIYPLCHIKKREEQKIMNLLIKFKMV